MPSRRCTWAFVVLIFAAVCASAPSPGAAATHGDAKILVQFKDALSPTGIDAALAAAGSKRVGAVRGLGVAIAMTNDVGHAVAALSRNPHVGFAEPDLLLAPQDLLPSDPSFPVQNGVAGGAWGWTKTHTTQAWDVTTGSSSVVVAVLDTGLRALPDFNGQVVPGWNVLSGTSDTSSNAGLHGTYVAGVVGLALDNGIGNAGYCPGCRIMPVQVGTDAGAYVSDMANGIVWAADHGARVINLSFAGAIPSTTLDDAVAYARGKGVVVVAAAGNSNCDCSNYPAASPGVLGVAGTDSVDAKASDSNFGTWVALAAPESNMTAWPSLNGAVGYAPVGGTSLAAPVVAGIAGLLFSAAPAATGAQVEQALESSAVPLGFSVRYGRVDALAALNALGIADPQTPQAPVAVSPPQILLETNGDYDATPLAAAPQVGQVLLRGQGAWRGSAPLTLATVLWQRCAFDGTSCIGATTGPRYTVQATDAGSTFRLSITVKNGSGSTTLVTPPTLPVGTAAAPSPPVGTAAPSIAGTAQVGQTLTASAGSWTGAPTAFAYQWLRCSSSCTAIGGATAATYTVQQADTGTSLEVAVTATNAAGSATAVSAPTAPVAGAPVSITAPVITGTPMAGSTLSASTGTWSGGPSSFAFQWLRCSTSCTPLANATGSSYTPQAADAGATLEVAVTATSSSGSATATSAPTAPIAGAPAAPQTLVFTGSLTPSRASQTFAFTAGAGGATAQLVFSKCGSMTVALGPANATGPSGVTVSAGLAAGSSTATVSGGRCSFTLTVQTVAP